MSYFYNNNLNLLEKSLVNDKHEIPSKHNKSFFANKESIFLLKFIILL